MDLAGVERDVDDVTVETGVTPERDGRVRLREVHDGAQLPRQVDKSNLNPADLVVTEPEAALPSRGIARTDIGRNACSSIACAYSSVCAPNTQVEMLDVAMDLRFKNMRVKRTVPITPGSEDCEAF